MKKVYASLCALLILAVAAPCEAAKSCAAMKKELTELRREYHQYATVKVDDSGEAVKFDKLGEILDKIANLKREMTAEKCQVPPRNPDLKGKR